MIRDVLEDIGFVLLAIIIVVLGIMILPFVVALIVKLGMWIFYLLEKWYVWGFGALGLEEFWM